MVGIYDTLIIINLGIDHLCKLILSFSVNHTITKVSECLCVHSVALLFEILALK